MTTSNFTVFITFFQECDLTSVTPPPTSISTETEEGLREHETIVEEEEEEVEQFVCGTEEELDEQDVWEEDTVVSVVETASQIQSKGKNKAMSQTHF